MSRRPCLLGIDLGTSSCKVTLLDRQGNHLRSLNHGYSPLFVGDEGVEQDPETWWSAAVSAVRELIAGSQVEILAIGVTGQMRGVVLVGGDGLPVRPAVLWNDRRCRAQVIGLREEGWPELYRATRNPINEMCTLPKLLWLRKVEPELLGRAARLLFPKDYLRYRLCREWGTDVSDASGSSLYDIERGEWSQVVLDHYRIDGRILPEVHPSGEVVGTLTHEAAGALGIPEGVPVITGASDATAEMVALGLDGPSECKIRLGTSGALSTVAASIDGVNESLYIWSYLDRGRWMLDTNTRSCGQSVEWVRRLCYREQADPLAAYSVMADEGGRAPIGAGGLVYHPYLMGEDAPYWNPDLAGSLFGLRATHGRGHIVRSVYEGTAFALRDALSVFSTAGYRFEEFLVVGGGTQNPVWVQIVADVLGHDLVVPSAADSAVGAALLGGIGTGVIESVSAARKRSGRSIRVRAEAVETYSGLFERYREMKHVFDGLYGRSS